MKRRPSGLVSRIVPDEKVPDEARSMARVFATKSRTTMRLGRAAFVRATIVDYRRSIGDAVKNFCKVAATVDAGRNCGVFESARRVGSWRRMALPRCARADQGLFKKFEDGLRVDDSPAGPIQSSRVVGRPVTSIAS